jgi:hypothetical protein
VVVVPLLISINVLPTLLVLNPYPQSAELPPSVFAIRTLEVPAITEWFTQNSTDQSPLPGSNSALSATLMLDEEPLYVKYGDVKDTFDIVPLKPLPLKSVIVVPLPGYDVEFDGS